MFNILKELLIFLKNPIPEKSEVNNRFIIIKSFVTLLFVDIIFTFIYIYLTELTGILEKIDLENHSVNTLLNTIPFIIFLLLGTLILPFIEEVFFRLPLRFESNILIILLKNVIIKNEYEKLKLREIWKRNFKYIFYIFSIFFALIHFANFKYSNDLLLILPILILSQFVVGLLIGYLRVKFNFITGFLFHFTHNIIFLLFPVLFSYFFIFEKFENKNYSYKISYSNPFSDAQQFEGGLDYLKIKNSKLDLILSHLYNIHTNQIEIDNELQSLKFDFYFKQKNKKDSIDIKKIKSILQNFLNVEFKDTNKFEEIYLLKITDMNKLIKYQNKIKTDITKSTVSNDSISIKNGDIQYFDQVLTDIYKRNFKISDTINISFNFNFKKVPFEDLDSMLSRNIGINLVKSKKKVQYLEIVNK